MSYLESQRQKAIAKRNAMFNDNGGGIYRSLAREFILEEPTKNLYPEIRAEVQEYFSANNIVWWGGRSVPSGHLLSSQIACINHLFLLRNDKESALAVLKGLNPNFVEVCPDFEDAYVGFEVVSNYSYLNEVESDKKQTRGANCTSVDAMMTGVLEGGEKIQVLIEWKYTESYPKECKANGGSGSTRQGRYNHLITSSDSPLLVSVPIENFYYEPIYQLMRQTLLAWQMVKHKNNELGAVDWLHLDVIPEENVQLRNKVNAPELTKDCLYKSWTSLLKNPDKYRMITAQELLAPVSTKPEYKKLIQYLENRYW